MIERIDRKRQVLTYVAKYCFEGTLEAHKEFIPLEIVPHGSQPTHRCCVYREREASYCLADGVYTGVISEALQDELVRLHKWTYYLLK